MTFNIWQCGWHVENGTRKIVHVIRNSGADIVGLQVITCRFIERVDNYDLFFSFMKRQSTSSTLIFFLPQKILKHQNYFTIIICKFDIIPIKCVKYLYLLQEVEPNCIPQLQAYLPPEWTFVGHTGADYVDTAIVTRHPVWLHTRAQTNWTVGVKSEHKTVVSSLTLPN
jgi:hypothetical protein